MSRAKATICANKAMDAAEATPPILYSQEDCQGFIEQTVKRAGGTMKDYRGSNDMFRNACSTIVPLKGAKLEPGMVLFIVEKDGEEPPQYKADGLGNASHVGWYTGGRYEVVHSGATKGKVAASTLKNGWTHAGWLKEIDYGGTVVPQEEIIMEGYIKLPQEQNVFLRMAPSKTAGYYARINGGERVEILSESNGWTQVAYNGMKGYVASEFVSREETAAEVFPADFKALAIDLESIAERLHTIANALRQ